MPVKPSGDAVEPLMRAVHGARWVFWDEAHRLLFVGRRSEDWSYTVHVYDTVNGEPHDQPWPLDGLQVQVMGEDRAFAAAVAERVAQGY